MLLGHVHRGRLGGRRRRGEGTKGRIVPLLAESVVPTDPHSKNDASPAAAVWGRAWGEKIDVATGRLRAYPVLVLWASTNLPPQVGSSEREGVGSRDPAGLSLCCLDWGEELGGEVTGGQALFRAVELEQWLRGTIRRETTLQRRLRVDLRRLPSSCQPSATMLPRLLALSTLLAHTLAAPQQFPVHPVSPGLPALHSFNLSPSNHLSLLSHFADYPEQRLVQFAEDEEPVRVTEGEKALLVMEGRTFLDVTEGLRRGILMQEQGACADGRKGAES